jgi:hypothetical protein
MNGPHGSEIQIVRVIATPSPFPTPSPKPTARPPKSVRHDAAPGPSVRTTDDIEWPWISIADCESGDGPKAAGPPYHPDWDYHGSTYDGGLNFAYGTWDDAWEFLRASLDRTVGKAKRIARIGKASLDAWRHRARTQVDVAKDWLKRTDWGQWPVCSRVVGVR